LALHFTGGGVAGFFDIGGTEVADALQLGCNAIDEAEVAEAAGAHGDVIDGNAGIDKLASLKE
jgi:hypothetical protein